MYRVKAARKRRFPSTLSVVLLFVALPGLGALDWAETLDAGVALAARRSEPLLVIVEGPQWCLQCADAVLQMERLAGRLADIVAVRVADDAAIVERFAIRRLPTMIVLDSDGVEIHRWLYRQNEAALIDFVTRSKDAAPGQVVQVGATRLHRGAAGVWHLPEPYPVGPFREYDQDETFWYLRHENATILAVAKDASAVWSWDHGAETWQVPE